MEFKDNNYVDYLIIDMYKKGYSIKKITDEVFRYSKRNVPKNNSYSNCAISPDKTYARIDCSSYVARTILNRNRSSSAV